MTGFGGRLRLIRQGPKPQFSVPSVRTPHALDRGRGVNERDRGDEDRGGLIPSFCVVLRPAIRRSIHFFVMSGRSCLTSESPAWVLSRHQPRVKRDLDAAGDLAHSDGEWGERRAGERNPP